MGRPPKDGIDYFPMDVNFYNDDKVRVLKLDFGAKGMYILGYILCEIYGKNGYYMQWDNSKCYLVSDGAGCGCRPEFISEFISRCVKCHFFDERVFNSFGVLTSRGIQKRFMQALRNRSTVKMIEEYWLLDINNRDEVPASVLNKLAFKNLASADNPVLSTDNSVLSAEKYTKEKKGKEKKYYRKNSGVKNSSQKTFNAEEFDGYEDYTVPDLSKRKVEK